MKIKSIISNLFTFAKVLLACLIYAWSVCFCTELDKVTIAILAKDKAHILPAYLACIENQTWPKDRTYIYIRSNNNKDNTIEILQQWVEKVKDSYLGIYYDYTDTEQQVQKYGAHEWNCERFKVLGRIRQDSMDWAYNHNSHYFVVDCDNIIKQNTLEALMEVDLPIVAPLLRANGNSCYANFHAAIDKKGYFASTPFYYQLLKQEIKDVTAVPVVHCTYLVRHEVIKKLTYDDNSYRYEYVIFSDSARKNNISQYLDTRELYGYCSFSTDRASFAAERTLQEFLRIIKIQ